MKNLIALPFLFILSFCLAAQAQETPAQRPELLTLTFEVVQFKFGDRLVSSGPQAAGLFEKLSPAPGVGGAGELIQREGKVLCSARPQPGVGTAYECLIFPMD